MSKAKKTQPDWDKYIQDCKNYHEAYADYILKLEDWITRKKAGDEVTAESDSGGNPPSPPPPPPPPNP